jgi:hypothetical protein
MTDDEKTLLAACAENDITEVSDITDLVDIKRKYETNFDHLDEVDTSIRELLSHELNDEQVDLVNATLETLKKVEPVINPDGKPRPKKDSPGKDIGKLYSSTNGNLTVLCTGPGKSKKQFAGVVVEQKDPTSDFQIGDYSETWTNHEIAFKECETAIIITNTYWKPRVQMGATPGKW